MTDISRYLVDVSLICYIYTLSSELNFFPQVLHPSLSLPALQHLLTYSLEDGDVQNVEEAQLRLSVLAQNKKLWSQQMYLEVGAEAIHLRDTKSQVRGQMHDGRTNGPVGL